MKIEKSREEKESDIISEFVKELDLSDERVKKRLIVESMRQEVFQTPIGEQFLKALSQEEAWDEPQKRRIKRIQDLLQSHDLKQSREFEKSKVLEKTQEVGKKSWWKRHSKRLVFLGSVMVITTGVTAAVIYAGAMKRNKEGGISEDWYQTKGVRQKKESTEFDPNEAGGLEKSDGIEFVGFQHYNESYLVKDSDTTALSEKELKSFTYEQLNLALHEIYARHGRRFFNVNIQSYFEQKAWYQPMDESVTYSDTMLNEVERWNIVLLKEQMDQYELENEDVAYDYGSLTIDDMKESLKKTHLLEGDLEEVKDSAIRAMYYDLMEAGYLVNGKLNLGQVGSI